MHRPDRATVIVFCRQYILLSLVFVVIYGGMNYLTSVRRDWYHLYFDWEQNIPFVPGFIYVYLSIFLVFLLPLVALDQRQIRALSRAAVVATLAAGLVFFALPAELAMQRPASVPGHEWVYAALYKLELPYNLFPSLHVTYASLFLYAVIRNEKTAVTRAGLVLWWVLLVASVLLVRQHHLVDIVGGVTLAAICYRAVYRPRATAAG